MLGNWNVEEIGLAIVRGIDVVDRFAKDCVCLLCHRLLRGRGERRGRSKQSKGIRTDCDWQL